MEYVLYDSTGMMFTLSACLLKNKGIYVFFCCFEEKKPKQNKTKCLLVQSTGCCNSHNKINQNNKKRFEVNFHHGVLDKIVFTKSDQLLSFPKHSVSLNLGYGMLVTPLLTHCP